MSSANVCEAGEPHVYEREVARLWFALPAGTRLPLSNGDSCQLVFSGLPGSAAGPDVRDAVLSFSDRQDGPVTVGDIEFHVRASHWFAHQHHTDARYNNVMLHVVLICDTLSPALRQDGTSIPTCSLYDLQDLALPPLPRPAQPALETSWPCHSVMQQMSAEEHTRLLMRAGLLRFEQKTQSFVELLHKSEPHPPFSAYDACLIVALAEGLGYGRDRAFFHAAGEYLLGLPGKVPEPLGKAGDPPPLDGRRLAALRKLVDQWRMHGAWESIRKILYPVSSRGGGGCGCGDGTLASPSRLSMSSFPSFGGPISSEANDQNTNICNSLSMHFRSADTTCNQQGATQASPPIPASAPAPTDKILPQLQQLRTIFSELGTARADILICNVVLPFAAAVALIENDAVLAGCAQTLYEEYPGLSSNRVTRAMTRQLLLEREPEGACQQQGLHYIYQQTCKEKRCELCIAGRLPL